MKLKFNEQYHTYWLNGKQAKGVTTVAKIGTNTYNLEQYALRMTAIGVAKTPHLIEAIAVNYDDRAKMKDLCYKAQTEAKAFAASDRGTNLHQVVERHDLGLDMIETERNIAIRKAWTSALDEYALDPIADYVERIVVYPEYRLCGTLDRILVQRHEPHLVIADAKGGKNAIDYPHAIAVQLALYAHAPLLAGRLNSKGETTEFTPMPDVDKTTGYVIWMPEDDRAEVVPIDIKAGWECFNDVILPTLAWQERDDLIIHRAAAGSALGEVSPAAAPNLAAPAAATPQRGTGSDAGPEAPPTSGPATNAPISLSTEDPLKASAAIHRRLKESETCKPTGGRSSGRTGSPSECAGSEKTSPTATSPTGSGNPPTTTSKTTTPPKTKTTAPGTDLAAIIARSRANRLANQ